MSLAKIFMNVEECFCGCSLKVASLIVTIVELIVALILFGVSAYLSTLMLSLELYETFEEDVLWPKLYIIFILFSILLFVSIFFGALGILGMIKGNSHYVKLWLYHQIISTLVTIVLTVATIIFTALVTDNPVAIYIGLYLCLNTVVRWSSASVVHTHYKSMGVDTMQGFQLPTVALRRTWSPDAEAHQELSEHTEPQTEIRLL